MAACIYDEPVSAAPLKVTRESLQDGKLRAIVVNSGNANACTGKQGEEDAYDACQYGAQFGLDENDVAVASTGVIGELLKMDRVSSGIAGLPTRLSGGSEGAESFSQAILTTDLVKRSLRDRSSQRYEGDYRRNSEGVGDDSSEHGDHARIYDDRCGHWSGSAAAGRAKRPI